MWKIVENRKGGKLPETEPVISITKSKNAYINSAAMELVDLEFGGQILYAVNGGKFAIAKGAKGEGFKLSGKSGEKGCVFSSTGLSNVLPHGKYGPTGDQIQLNGRTFYVFSKWETPF